MGSRFVDAVGIDSVEGRLALFVRLDSCSFSQESSSKTEGRLG